MTLAHQAADDPQARERLVARLRPRVRRLACSLLRHAADADDATQLALLEILKAAPGYRGESTLEAWGDRIAARVAIRIARERRLASVRADAEVTPDELHAPASPPSFRDAIPRPLRAYLDQLPEARRTVLVLRHAFGHSVDEISDLTGASVNTVKDRLLHARDEVRRMVRRDVALGTAPGLFEQEGEP